MEVRWGSKGCTTAARQIVHTIQARPDSDERTSSQHLKKKEWIKSPAGGRWPLVSFRIK